MPEGKRHERGRYSPKDNSRDLVMFQGLWAWIEVKFLSSVQKKKPRIVRGFFFFILLLEFVAGAQEARVRVVV